MEGETEGYLDGDEEGNCDGDTVGSRACQSTINSNDESMR